MKQFIALGLCILLLTACTTSNTDTTTSVTPTTLPETTVSTTTPETSIPETETTVPLRTEFILYAPNDTLDGFHETKVEIEDLTASNVVQMLIDAGVLTDDVSVNAELIDNGNLSIDLNTAFQDQIWTLGSTGERYLIASVVNTFLSAYGVETVSITVDSEILESGHVIYDFPMEFFES